MDHVVRAYLEHPEGSLFHHQIESYDAFMQVGLEQIVHHRRVIRVEAKHEGGPCAIEIEFGRVTVFPPCVREHDGQTRPLSPLEARVRKLTYQVGVGVDVEQRMYKMDENDVEQLESRKTFCEVPIVQIPCMLNSSYCIQQTSHVRESVGGYFIINGHEKTCQAQIKLRINCPFTHKSVNGYYSEVRSCNEASWRSTVSLRVLAKRGARGGLFCTVPAFTDEIPLFVVLAILSPPRKSVNDLLAVIVKHITFWARGACTVDLVDLVGRGVPAVELGAGQNTRGAMLDHAAQEYTKERTPDRRLQCAMRALNTDLLPHLGGHSGAGEVSTEAEARKFTFVCRMASQALCALHAEGDGIDQSDNRDHWRHKRIDSCGQLIAMLFRQLWRNFSRSLEVQLRKNFESDHRVQILQLMTSRKMETGLKFHFSTGVWSVMKGVDSSANSGVCQQISYLSRMAAISSLRRINCPVNRQGKTAMPRMLHISDYGHVCTTETPEGSGCGLILNLPIICHVRIGGQCMQTLTSVVTALVGAPESFVDWVPDLSRVTTVIVINGFLWGIVDARPEDVRTRLRDARHGEALPRDCSIFVENECVHLHSDAGAVVRPIVRLDRIERLRALNPKSSWDAFFATGAVEYVDQEEIDAHCRVAATAHEIKAGHTHVEISAPATLMGIAAALTPFANHNQSPRNIYQAAMGKQAIPCDNGGVGMAKHEAHKYSLWYGQRSLCETTLATVISDLFDLPEHSTFEATLMISSWSGFGQEDAIVVKKEAIERGMGVAVVFRTYTDELNIKGNDDEAFAKPSNAVSMKHANYSKLQDDGTPMVGAELSAGDVIIGKTSQTMQLGPDGSHKPLKFDRSTVVKEDCVVDNVCFTENRDGKKQVKVRVRTLRIPQAGDKFASRHAQKGTIGYIAPSEDLPFDRDGISPDIIINPHAFITRMTIGMMIEALAGKAAALDGAFVDASPFSQRDVVSHAQDVLTRHGFHPSGEQSFTDGRSGKPIRARTFMGLCSYQRLRHLVEEKRHSRRTGNKHILTNQVCPRFSAGASTPSVTLPFVSCSRAANGRTRQGGRSSHGRDGEGELLVSARPPHRRPHPVYPDASQDCMVAYGCSALIGDRMLDQSDRTVVTYCNLCGLPAEQAHSGRFAAGLRTGKKAFCRNCSDGAHCVEVQTPSANRLFNQELMAFGVAMRVKTRKVVGAGESVVV
tara:strand:+ start:1627 stop:5232 length:3606 start_codon:yes stop_codon:yes gene_type:complete